MEKKFLGPKEVSEVLGISIPTFYRYVKAGDIPPADMVVGTNRNKWHIDTILKHLKNKGEKV